MIDPFVMDAYFEARLAFVDRPEARISTDTDTHPGAVFIRVRERIDNEVFALSYSVLREYDRDPLALKVTAEKARSKYRYELDKREPARPFDMELLQYHVRLNASELFPLDLRVNDAWDGERMRLGRSEVVVSPDAYLAVMRNLDRDIPVSY